MAVVISSRWRVKQGEEAAIVEALAALLPLAREEPGCLLLQAHRDPDDPQIFYFYEQYVDEAALAAHAETDHWKHYIRDVCLPRVESRERGTYLTWEPD